MSVPPLCGRIALNTSKRALRCASSAFWRNRSETRSRAKTETNLSFCDCLLLMLWNGPQKHGDRSSSADGVKDGKSRSTGEIDSFSTAELFRAYHCRNFCFHVCLVRANASARRGAADCGEHRQAAGIPAARAVAIGALIGIKAVYAGNPQVAACSAVVTKSKSKPQPCAYVLHDLSGSIEEPARKAAH
jgi:hypothetical protein